MYKEGSASSPAEQAREEGPLGEASRATHKLNGPSQTLHKHFLFLLLAQEKKKNVVNESQKSELKVKK